MTKHPITLDGIEIDLERKRVKNVNFTIYPPDGRVRVSAPRRMPKEKLEQIIRARLPWIKKHRARIVDRVRTKPLQYVSGEKIPVFGDAYRLEVYEHNAAPKVELGANGRIECWVRTGSDRSKRESVLNEWYRAELKARIPPLINLWEPVMGVKVAEWGVKRMKTRWGSCNTKACRIWVNLELAKHPLERLEYIIVHEMVHLLERRHNQRFYAYMDRFLPDWRAEREALKAAPIGISAEID